ncbi:ferredoxin [Spirillospora sp. NBC_00431]
MKIEVDTGRCCSSGMCAMTAPQVFDQSEDDGTVVLLDPVPAGEDHAAVLEAAEMCPSGAITVVDVPGGVGTAGPRPSADAGEEGR